MIIIKAKFEKLEKLTTKTKLVFSTNQRIPEVEYHQLILGDGFLAFNPDEYRARVQAIIKDKKIGINDLGQTPSELLRKTLFLVAEARGLAGNFEEFYEQEMQKIREHYQSKYL